MEPLTSANIISSTSSSSRSNSHGEAPHHPLLTKVSTNDYVGDDASYCKLGDIYISHSHEEPLSWKETLFQPFMSCGFCHEDIEEDFMTPEKMETDTEDLDWGTLIWHLSGMEFIRISCIDPDVMESLGHDKIIISNMGM